MEHLPETDEVQGQTGDLADADYNDGHVRGDSRAMPFRGSDTGVSDSYGADLAPDAINRHGTLGADTRSDAPFAEFSGDTAEDGANSED